MDCDKQKMDKDTELILKAIQNLKEELRVEIRNDIKTELKGIVLELGVELERQLRALDDFSKRKRN